MKFVFKRILLNTLAIAAVSYVFPGVSYNHDLKTLLIAALVLAIINTFIRPFLKILLLPINVITLGLFGWFINVIIIYLTTLVTDLSISAFDFSIAGSSLHISVFWAYVLTAFALNIFTTIISWVVN
jgi:putative membrane protein